MSNSNWYIQARLDTEKEILEAKEHNVDKLLHELRALFKQRLHPAVVRRNQLDPKIEKLLKKADKIAQGQRPLTEENQRKLSARIDKARTIIEAQKKIELKIFKLGEELEWIKNEMKQLQRDIRTLEENSH